MITKHFISLSFPEFCNSKIIGESSLSNLIDCPITAYGNSGNDKKGNL